MKKMAEEEAERRRRKPKDWDYKGRFREFNAYYSLSTYDRLPREKLADARRYLEKKMFAERKGETRRQERNRCIRGVKKIQRRLGIAEARLTPFGNGLYAPVASNKDEEGRAKNRRVELVEVATK